MMRKFKFSHGFVATCSDDPVKRLDDLYLALFVRVESVARRICAPTRFERLIEKARKDECTNLEWRKVGRVHDQLLDEMEDRAPIGQQWTQWQKDGITYWGYAPIPEEESPPVKLDRKGCEVKLDLTEASSSGEEFDFEKTVADLKEFVNSLGNPAHRHPTLPFINVA
jgi:hypothetical protein